MLARNVPFQDTAVTLRRIRDVDPDTTVAAYTRTGHRGWLLLSPRSRLAAEWADAALRSVVLQTERCAEVQPGSSGAGASADSPLQ